MGRHIEFRGTPISEVLLKDADILVLENGIRESINEPEELIKTSFQGYFTKRSLKDIIGKRKKIGIILNDRNRPTPSHILIEHLIENEPWIIERVTKVCIATGTHDPPGLNDLKAILGHGHGIFEDRIHIHMAKDERSHRRYGRTSRGTEIYFDRVLDDMDFLIFVNSVEPHYFAGFTGGRKSLLPGMASFGTVERNHSYSLQDGSKTLGLEGNPVHEDMMEASELFLNDRAHLSVQMVLSSEKEPTGVFIGDLKDSFLEAVEFAMTKYCVPINKKYDIVISFANEPMDRTLYQSQKALEHGKLALKDGGIIILVSRCHEGIGQSSYWDLLTSDIDKERILKRIGEKYVLGAHKAARMLQLAEKATIYMVTDLPENEVSKGFMTGFKDLDEAMEMAREKIGKDASVLMIPDGCSTVPMYGGRP